MPSSSVGKDRSHLDGHEVEIFKLVQNEATSEQWREWLRTPLEHAAAKGNVDLFTRLMDAGADGGAGWRGCRGRTLLGAAAGSQSEKMVLDLLEAGAKDDLDMIFEDHNGRRTSALHEAARKGADCVSQALILAGADPNQLDGDGKTPLELAARAGHAGVLGNLLLKGAYLDTANNFNETPLHLAAEEGHVLCVSRLLLSGADKDSLDAYASTPLLLAARNGHLGVVEKLLAAGARLDLVGDDGWNPVEDAAHRGNARVLKALLENGGEANAPDEKGFTPLHFAALLGTPEDDNSDTIRVLLEAGADVEAKSEDGSTPLICANCSRRHASIGTVRALLEGGGDVNARDEDDCTPLRRACIKSDAAAVKLLLRWGADETLTYTDGTTVVNDVGQQLEGVDVVIDQQRRRADDQCIRLMLARAPADRSWRRRGWLVLLRCRPRKVQLATDNSSSSSSSSSGKPVKGARLNDVPSNRIDDGRDSGHLVGGVVGLEAEGVFRLVVGFL